MSQKDINIMVELLQIFIKADEEGRTKILETSQTLIKKPDHQNPTS